jgi:flagellar motor switch protein FliN
MSPPSESPVISLATAVMGELATVLGMLLGEELSCESVTDPGETDWAARIEVSGATAGTLTLGVANDAVVSLAGRILGLDTAPPDAEVTDAFQEAFNQVVGSLNQNTPESGMTATLQSFEQSPSPEGAPLAVFELTIDGAPCLRAACWGSVEEQTRPDPEPASAPAPAPAAAPAPAPAPAHVPDVTKDDANHRNLDILLDIELPFSVRFGQVDMTIGELSRLGPGAVVSLGRLPDDPVEVLINSKVVARGEVVVVAGNYGVRIIDVASREERIRSMGD